ncbi:MAG: GNAT family N-acetyltransferase [Alicyclobacillus macrosporangiidus]|uniref:GNAT family N-acetyltransferase n=1 Tax=Alicyclobacillus macrosporangiidus TaxID=392015 RepID=UPI0034E94394|nr:GNAT family N-acetyltransferase [Alicyclobacillus macrosporangiidus]
MLFENGPLGARRIQPHDYPLLSKWLSDPRVLRFYEGRDNPHDLEKVKQVFGSKDDRGVTGCILHCDGKEIGYVQFYLLSDAKKSDLGLDPTKVVYGMDQFIGEPDYWNRGVGTTLVKSMADYLRNKLGADHVIMDPQAWNTRAMRSYEKAGFRKFRWLPKHELHEGEWRDCWLMMYPADEGCVRLVQIDPAEAGADAKEILSAAIFNPTAERIDDILSQVYSSPDTCLFGFLLDGALVGVAGIRRMENSTAELLHIAIKQSERHKGFGREFVRTVIHSEKLTELHAETDRESAGFYRRCDFSVESLGEKYPGVERFVCRWSQEGPGSDE